MSGFAFDQVVLSGPRGPRLDQVSLKVGPGEHVMVVGPNGAGKSTLLAMLRGQVAPERGQVTLSGQDPRAGSARERAARLAWLPQHPRIEDGLSALEVVAAARFRFGEPRRVARQRAEAALNDLGAESLMERPMNALSGGEAQRVRLASLRAQEAQIWLLDEPTNHLDPALRFDLVDTLIRMGQAGTSLVWVTHDLTLIPEFHLPNLTVVGMDRGRIVFALSSGAPELPERIGALFGVRLETVTSARGPRWVVARGGG